MNPFDELRLFLRYSQAELRMNQLRTRFENSCVNMQHTIGAGDEAYQANQSLGQEYRESVATYDLAVEAFLACNP